MKKVQIITDGACLGNPGPGGWAAILRYGDIARELWGWEPYTTNNRMELRAAIEGLGILTRPCAVDLYCDSQYVVKGIQSWLAGWKRKGWRKADGQPVINVDLWQALDAQLKAHRVTAHWVRGHAGHAENERVDRLAFEAARNQTS